MIRGLSDAVAEIDAVLPDARSGLPDPLFYLVSRLTPLNNVDLLIKNEAGQTLLTWREDQYYGPGWHIPGGIIRFKERWETRIVAVAERELGTAVTFDETPLSVKQLFAPNRDIRGHFISLLFRCALVGSPKAELAFREGRPKNGQWAWHDKFPEDIVWQQKVYRDFF